MNYIKAIILGAAVAFSMSCAPKQQQAKPNDDKALVVGTFNMEWLGDGKDDKKPRNESDFEAMAKVVNELNADIIGVQEVENDKAMNSLMKFLPDYDFVLDHNGHEQNVGFIFRRGLSVKSIGTYFPIAIDTSRNRPGYVVYVRKGNFDSYIMTVHLKSTSQYDDTEEKRQASKEMRTKQSEIMSVWADSILANTGERNVIIVGDFNDFPLRWEKPTLTAIYKNPNMKFLTDSTKSCKFTNKFGIDQIVVSKETLRRYKQQGVFVYDTYSALGKEKAGRISDHCPLTIRLDLSDSDEDTVEISK